MNLILLILGTFRPCSLHAPRINTSHSTSQFTTSHFRTSQFTHALHSCMCQFLLRVTFECWMLLLQRLKPVPLSSYLLFLGYFVLFRGIVAHLCHGHMRTVSASSAEYSSVPIGYHDEEDLRNIRSISWLHKFISQSTENAINKTKRKQQYRRILNIYFYGISVSLS